MYANHNYDMLSSRDVITRFIIEGVSGNNSVSGIVSLVWSLHQSLRRFLHVVDTCGDTGVK